MLGEAFYPGRVPIDAYGNGGFRFAEAGHRGSLLMLPSGVWAWDVECFDNLKECSFAQVVLEKREIEFLLLGTGETQIFPERALFEFFEANDMGLEAMGTGAACRTYNVLLAEGRAVAAALIAVA